MGDVCKNDYFNQQTLIALSIFKGVVIRCTDFTHQCYERSYDFIKKPTLFTYLSILKGVTISGKVMFWAIDLGTPT